MKRQRTPRGGDGFPLRHRLAALVFLLALVAAGCGRPGAASARAGAEPGAGLWRTWVLASPWEVWVPPPAEPGSPAAAADAARLRAAVAGRTREVVAQVDRWDAEPAVAPWMELALDFVAQRTKDPVAASRSYALVAVAMYDAVAAAWHYKYHYGRAGPGGIDRLVEAEADPSYPSGHAAVAGAASVVLAHVFPEQPAVRLEHLAEEAARSRVTAGASFPSDVEAGLALGRAVGELVLERAQAEVVVEADVGLREGAAGWERLRPDGALLWRQPPGSVQVPVSPLAGTWDTWVLASGDQFRPPPFPAVDSEEFFDEALEVYEVGNNLTAGQKRIAKFWEGGQGTPLPPGIWNEAVLALLGEEWLSLPRAARALALVNVAMDDAGVAAWDAKYAYWGPRPVNAIRDLGIAPEWEPYLRTPVFPGYVSGHATYSGAASTVLGHLFPDRADVLDARAREASLSRLYGGIHMRSDNEAGLELGRKIGALVVERARRDGAER